MPRPGWFSCPKARMRHLMHIGITERTASSSRQRWFIFALCLLFAAESIQYAIKVSGSTKHEPRSAIARWGPQLRHLGDEDIYERYNYPNPPIMALLLEPIAHLPPLLGSISWFYLKL